MAVFHRLEVVIAVGNACPHAGIDLVGGDMEDFGKHGVDGHCIACPAHCYVFDTTTGACITNPKTRAATLYDTRVEPLRSLVEAILAQHSPHRLRLFSHVHIIVKATSTAITRWWGGLSSCHFYCTTCSS